MNSEFEIDTEYHKYIVIRTSPDKIMDIYEDISGIDFIYNCISDINLNNKWYSKNTRQYVNSILKNRYFSISNPCNGKKLNLGATYTFDDFQTIFFFFDDKNIIGLVASDLASGFPLSTIILFDRKIIIHLTDSFWGLGERHFKSLSERGDQIIRQQAQDCDICLVAGDPNFAHHAWNELSALQEIAGEGFDSTTSLVVVHEPLGPVNDILGSCFRIALKLPKARLPEINRRGALTFCATGTIIDKPLVDKILHLAQDNLSPFGTEVQHRLAAKPGHSLWVSVRTRNRTIASQVEVLAALIKDYLQDRNDRMVVIDGHSLPFDQQDDAAYIQDLNISIVQDDGIVAEQIITAVKAVLPDANIVKFVGRKIHESIAVGRYAGFYFCHHGTVQHKLGWFSDIEGLVHCNREILEILPAHWVSQQSEVAALPVYLPIDMIEDAIGDDVPGELQMHLHHNDYRINDIASASRMIADFANMVEKTG